MVFAEIETSVLVGVATFISIVSGTVGAFLMKVLPVWQANRSKDAEDRRLTEAHTAQVKREAFDQVSEEYQSMLQRAAEDTRKRDDLIDRQGKKIDEMFKEIRALTEGHADCLVKNEKLAARVEVLESRLQRVRVQESLSDMPTRAEALVVADEHGVIREWNQAATLLLHWNVDEAVGNNIEIVIPQRWLKQHRAGWQDVLANERAPGRGPYFVHALTREQELIPVELTLSGWQVDGKRFFGAALRKRVEVPGSHGQGKDVEEDVSVEDLKANPDPLGSGVLKKGQTIPTVTVKVEDPCRPVCEEQKPPPQP